MAALAGTFTLPPPTPVLVLSLGEWGKTIYDDILPLYLRSDPRRVQVTRMIEVTLQDSVQMRADLETAIDRLRAHSALLRAGFEDATPPLILLALANLWQADDCTALLPVAFLLQDLSRSRRGMTVNFLLNIVRFPSEIKTQQEIDLLCNTLMDIQTAVEPGDPAALATLGQRLDIQQGSTLLHNFFILDYRMKGGRNLLDRDEVKVLAGNCLLSLMNAPITQKLNERSYTDLLGAPQRLRSIGAALLVYDPRPVQEYCALRLVMDILKAEFLDENQPQTHLIEHKVNEVLVAPCNELPRWIATALGDLPFQVLYNDGIPTLLWNNDLVLEPFDPEYVRRLSWAKMIGEHDEQIRKVKQPHWVEKMTQQVDQLEGRLLAVQDQVTRDLPQDLSLYPGGITAAMAVLHTWRQYLQSATKTIALARERLPRLEDCERYFQQNLQDLEEAIQNFPTLPWWITWLPNPLRRRLVDIYSVVRFGETIQHLLDLRNQTLQNQQRCYQVYQEQALWSALDGMLCRLESSLEQSLDSLANLGRTLQQAYQSADQLLSQFCFAPQDSLAHNEFRSFPTGRDFADWTYRQHAAPPEILRQPVLEQEHALDNWPQLDTKTLLNRLLDFGKSQFSYLNNLTLDEVLKQYVDAIPESSPMITPAERLRHLVKATLPLADPQFDRLGAGFGQPGQQWLLMRDGQDESILSTLQDLLDRWTVLSTTDPYLISTCQITAPFPLAALPSLDEMCTGHFS